MLRHRQPLTTTSMQSSSSTCSNISARRPVATLDLHGYHRGEAIRRLTDYLDQQAQNNRAEQVWVCVITGSGVHSTEGPVLRNAVQDLFVKRQMEYHINTGKGSLTVNAKSGIVLHKQKVVDSKITIVPHSSGPNVKLIGRVAPKSRAFATINNQANFLLHHPLPNHVAQDDALLVSVQHESRKEQYLHIHKTKHSKQELARVLSDSKLDYDRTVQSQNDYDGKLQQALQTSESELQDDQDADEKELQAILAKSVADLQHQEEEEERELQAILTKSMSEACLSNNLDDTFEAAMKLSFDEFRNEEEVLRLALEQSMYEV